MKLINSIYYITMVLLIAGSCSRGYFVDDRDTCNTLSVQGYTGCAIQERHKMFAAWNGCSGGDAAATDVATKNPLGRDVVVTVCCGWPLGGCTIRTH